MKNHKSQINLESKEAENMTEFIYVGTSMNIRTDIHKDLLANC